MTKRRLLVSLAVLAIAIQFVPVERSNPLVESEVAAPSEVRSIFERACYDCHSYETVWPWYSRIAPVSWLLAHDVEEAREHLNFSAWDSYSQDEQRKLREEIWEEVEDGKMPLWLYAPLHPEAALSAEDKELIRFWFQPTGQERWMLLEGTVAPSDARSDAPSSSDRPVV